MEPIPRRALRHLFEHSEVHFNVDWRDIAAEDWGMIEDAAGDPLPDPQDAAYPAARC